MSEESIRRSSISQAATYEEMGEFWDTHSVADYWDQTCEVEMEIRIPRRVALAEEVYRRLSEEARRQGVAPETLANLWLVERLRALVPAAVKATTEGSGEAEPEGAEEWAEIGRVCNPRRGNEALFVKRGQYVNCQQVDVK